MMTKGRRSGGGCENNPRHDRLVMEERANATEMTITATDLS